MAALRRSHALEGLQCARRLWWGQREPRAPHVPDPLSPAEQVHAAAREEFPDGVRIPQSLSWAQALEQTRQALESERVVFRGALEGAGLQIRPDILLRLPKGGWRLMRVKAATKIRRVHVRELALEWLACEALGMDIREAGVLHLNRRHRPERNEPLLRFSDRSDSVREQLPELPAELEALRAELALEEAPEALPGRRCYWPRPCPYLRRCKAPEPIELPDGPGPHAAMVRAAQERETLLVLPSLREKIQAESAYFLDFEAVSPPIPRFEGCRPFSTLPVQFSLHRLEGDQLSHVDFLHRDPSDPRPPLARALLAALERPGPIFVWGEFESRVIRKLGQQEPELAPRLQALVHRLRDLQVLARAGAWHPGFSGSWSIKRVLPVLAPGHSYDGLELSDGGQAVQAWTHMQHERTSPERREALARSLLAYCNMDTLALVHIREALLAAEVFIG